MTQYIPFFVLLAPLCALWVYFDGRRNRLGQQPWFTMTPFIWAFCTLGCWPVFFPLYLVRRKSMIRLAAEHPCTFESAVGMKFAFFTASVLLPMAGILAIKFFGARIMEAASASALNAAQNLTAGSTAFVAEPQTSDWGGTEQSFAVENAAGEPAVRDFGTDKSIRAFDPEEPHKDRDVAFGMDDLMASLGMSPYLMPGEIQAAAGQDRAMESLKTFIRVEMNRRLLDEGTLAFCRSVTLEPVGLDYRGRAWFSDGRSVPVTVRRQGSSLVWSAD